MLTSILFMLLNDSLSITYINEIEINRQPRVSRLFCKIKALTDNHFKNGCDLYTTETDILITNLMNFEKWCVVLS